MRRREQYGCGDALLFVPMRRWSLGPPSGLTVEASQGHRSWTAQSMAIPTVSLRRLGMSVVTGPPLVGTR